MPFATQGERTGWPTSSTLRSTEAGGSYKNNSNLLGRRREIEELEKNVSLAKEHIEEPVIVIVPENEEKKEEKSEETIEEKQEEKSSKPNKRKKSS